MKQQKYITLGIEEEAGVEKFLNTKLDSIFCAIIISVR
jgi:hypothetical protein